MGLTFRKSAFARMLTAPRLKTCRCGAASNFGTNSQTSEHNDRRSYSPCGSVTDAAFTEPVPEVPTNEYNWNADQKRQRTQI